jgi:hypothetical protein
MMITTGADWQAEIEAASDGARVVVAVIGPGWHRELARLWDPSDVVAFELKVAIDKVLPILPVLVDGASMPTSLPDSLHGLRRWQGLDLRERGMPTLIRHLYGFLAVPTPSDWTRSAYLVRDYVHGEGATKLVPQSGNRWARLRRAVLHRPEPLQFHVTHDPVTDIAVGLDRLSVVTVCRGQALRWQYDDFRSAAPIGQPGQIVSVAYSADGKTFASASADGLVRSRTELHVGSARRVALSPDGSVVAVASGDAVKLSPGPTIRHAGEVADVAFGGPHRLASGATDGAHVWDMSGRELACVRHRGPVVAVALAPGGALLVTGARERYAKLWDVATAGELERLEHASPVEDVVISPDGRFAATAAREFVRIWSMPGGGQINEIVHPMRVTRVRFSPDGSRLLTACDDGRGRAWTAREK